MSINLSSKHLNLPPLATCTVSVIGLGYVGLPLAVEFAKPQTCERTGTLLMRRVIGFDINRQRLDELRRGVDVTNETSAEELRAAQLLEFSDDPLQLLDADVFVVTVPTPIDSSKRPDLGPLKKASILVGRALKQRRSSWTPVVIYESTVYPGATEEVCVPIIELESGLAFNRGFVCGYSPERINPGDNKNKLTTIVKVTSGSVSEAAIWIDKFYSSIIKAGTHLAPSLKVAEAAKVIENTQRDLNIALMNELSIIFRHMGIDTLDVLEAAGTKWNFLPFRPGLVGGHCIGVDPYYLTYKAEQLGYYPQIVLAGRRINDSMGRLLAEQIILNLVQSQKKLVGLTVLVLGLTFKENCPDLRNTKVVDFIKTLQSFALKVDVVDPWADPSESLKQYGLSVDANITFKNQYDIVVLAVAHSDFERLGLHEWESLVGSNGLFVDLKGIVPRNLNPMRP